ncbi:MAG: dephospho-CoA kinase [Sphingopyxis sp.]|nr:dephospho-CoA kinase [Sphingopyxis sp.]
MTVAGGKVIRRPLIVGLTGSIGMGKSTIAAMARDLGIPVFDADAEVRLLQGPGGALVPAIEGLFPGTTNAAGVDREALGRAVFNDGDALKRLEALVHPAVADARRSFIDANVHEPIILFDVPLLFETGGDAAVDATIVVSAPAATQRERVLRRPGMTPEKLDAILARQMPDSDKRARADHVIDTGGTLDDSRAQLAAVIACLRPNAGA